MRWGPITLTTVRAVMLSTSAETRLPMTWIALLRGRVPTSLAASTEVEQPADVIKYLLAGADVVQSAWRCCATVPNTSVYC